MRWRQSRRSTNVEDRRGQRATRGGLRLGGGAGLLIIVVVILLGGDPRQVLQLLSGGGAMAPAPAPSAPGAGVDDEDRAFLSSVLAMTEDVWSDVFRANGVTYEPPTMVLFTNAVQSACGYSTSATGPFYCPPDRRLYLDTGFFDQLAAMGGAGDFAQAYVIGHEVGHHLQTLFGTSGWVRQLQSQARSQAEANQIQVLMELQADCYSGAWAHHANRRQQVLEPGDVEEGLAAAAAIGDDRLQRRAGRSISPESFTHGTSAQRQEWLDIGLRTGDLDACDTFGQAGYVRG